MRKLESYDKKKSKRIVELPENIVFEWDTKNPIYLYIKFRKLTTEFWDSIIGLFVDYADGCDLFLYDDKKKYSITLLSGKAMPQIVDRKTWRYYGTLHLKAEVE